MKYIIHPTEGIEFDGKRIDLGITAEELKAVLGEPVAVDTEDDVTRIFYYENELRFDLAKDGRLDFIEFLGGIDGEQKPVIYGADVFDTDADELTELLNEKNGGDIIDDDEGYSYAFPEIGIGISRSARPEDIEEMIEEYEEDGEEVDEEVLEFEKRRASHWETIGLGNSEYYDFLEE